MAAVIFYKFRAAREYTEIAVPPPDTELTLRHVKGRIMFQKCLRDDRDFDLELTDVATDRVLAPDSLLVPTGARLIVRRIRVAGTPLEIPDNHGDAMDNE